MAKTLQSYVKLGKAKTKKRGFKIMSSIIEQVAKEMNISSKELFSGKYGDSYDEILINLVELKKEGKN